MKLTSPWSGIRQAGAPELRKNLVEYSRKTQRFACQHISLITLMASVRCWSSLLKLRVKRVLAKNPFHIFHHFHVCISLRRVAGQQPSEGSKYFTFNSNFRKFCWFQTKQDFQKLTSNHNRVQWFSNFRNNKKAKTKQPSVIRQSFEKQNPQILHLATSLTSYSSCCSYCLFCSHSGLGSPTSRSSCSTLLLTKLLLGWAFWKRHNGSCANIY